MTTRAHGSRRHHGFKEEPDPPQCLERDRFSLRTLTPWLYKKIPSFKPSKQKKVVRNAASPERIHAWIKANGNATAVKVAAGLHVEPQTASTALVRNPELFRVVEDRKEPGRKPVKIWGIVEDD